MNMQAHPLPKTAVSNSRSRRNTRAWAGQQRRPGSSSSSSSRCALAPTCKAAAPRDVGARVGRRTVLGGLAPCACIGCRTRLGWYDQFFAFNMAHGMQEYEAAIAPVKQQLFQQGLQPLIAAGAITRDEPLQLLEVGIGTGPNLAYYQQQLMQQQSQLFKVVGVDPNPVMWPYSQQAAAAAGLAAQQLELVAGSAEALPLQNDSFDAAVITLVLCSLPNPGAALAEITRVLKPDGCLLFIEHVISPQLDWLQLQQRLLDPLQRLLADNCHLTRDTAALLQAQPGLELVPVELPTAGSVAGADGSRHGSSSSGGGGGLVRFEVEGMGLIAPHIAGILRKL